LPKYFIFFAAKLNQQLLGSFLTEQKNHFVRLVIFRDVGKITFGV